MRVNDENGITKKNDGSVAVDLVRGLRDGRIDPIGHRLYVKKVFSVNDRQAE